MTTRVERGVVDETLRALRRAPRLIQIITGPRQVGKTTAAQQVIARWEGTSRYVTADSPVPEGPAWLHAHWAAARRASESSACLLVIDEVQKIRGWSETVKALWDEDRRLDREVFVLLLGSSALLLAKGRSESLAGRFFLHRCTHWGYEECERAFAWDLDRWIFFGGYPGTAELADDEQAWKTYIRDALIETVLARDVLAMQNVNKPALLRNLFLLSTRFPSQILSYTKMLGQLQDAGNTTTLAHYLRLLQTAFLITGLERYSHGYVRSRSSSPKLILWNNALINAIDSRSYDEARSDPSWWGRLVENAVGAHLLNRLQGLTYAVSYWRHRQDEVDFVLRSGHRVWAIEVKSGRRDQARGLEAFCRRHPEATPLIVGTGGIPLDTFFREDPRRLLG